MWRLISLVLNQLVERLFNIEVALERRLASLLEYLMLPDEFAELLAFIVWLRLF